MKLVSGVYISEIDFEKSFDGTFNCFKAYAGLNKEVMFGGYEENGKFKIVTNRKGLAQYINGEIRVMKIEEYINKMYIALYR